MQRASLPSNSLLPPSLTKLAGFMLITIAGSFADHLYPTMSDDEKGEAKRDPTLSAFPKILSTNPAFPTGRSSLPSRATPPRVVHLVSYMIAEGNPTCTPTTRSRLDIQWPIGIERIVTLRLRSGRLSFFAVVPTLGQTHGLSQIRLVTRTARSLRRVECGSSFRVGHIGR